MGPVTTNPWLIALINMTIVFGVLIALGVLMNLLQVIDPTKKKVAKPAVAPTPAAAPAAAPDPTIPNVAFLFDLDMSSIAFCLLISFYAW